VYSSDDDIIDDDNDCDDADGCALYGVGLKVLDFWDRRFESL